MTRMSPRTSFILSLAAVLCASAFFAAPARAQEVPFEGVIAEDDVKARAGAGRTFYVVGALPKGTKVTVDEVIFGWHKIVPPAGVHSFISKAFVDAKGDGKVGEVNRDRAPVNAASLDGPADSYRHQLDLSKGDSVTILGEDGSFYKIAPPNLGATKKAYVYLPPGAVRRDVPETAAPATTTPAPATVTPAPATTTPAPTAPATTTPAPSAPATTTPAPTTPATTTPAAPTTPDATTPVAPAPATVTPAAPTTPATTTPAPATPATTTPATPDTVVSPAPLNSSVTTTSVNVPSPASLQKFEASHTAVKELEAKMAEALKLPIESQPIDDLIAAYSTAQTLQGLNQSDKFICAVRLAQLGRNQKVQAAVKAAKPTLTPDPKIAEKIETPGAQRAANYDATGQLMASSVYDGVRLPQLFRVVEPATNRTIVYVRPGAKFETPKALGRLVGITGKIRVDASLNLRVIDIDRLDVLDVAEGKKETETTATAGE